MKRSAAISKQAGYTLVEISVAVLVLVLIGGLAYSMMMGSTTLLAKNVSLNSSNTTVRQTLDRVYNEITQANGLPTLINADGTTASSQTAPAAGIMFDHYVGGPFMVGNPNTGLDWNTTSVKLFYSTNAFALPIQGGASVSQNDVVLMDGVTRALVQSVSSPSGYSAPLPASTPTTGKMITVTLQDKLGNFQNPRTTTGKAISWSSTVNEVALIVHRRALIVVPVNGRGELRYYPDAEVVTDFSNAANYQVLSKDIGTKTVGGATENLPFSIVTQNGLGFLNVAMRVEDQQFNKYLATRQVADSNNFLRVDTMLRPRNFLQ